MAITITIPKVLNEAVQKLADNRDCGNVSAVIRSALYKEAGSAETLQLHDGAAEHIKEAEARTVKYRVKRKRKEGGAQ